MHESINSHQPRLFLLIALMKSIDGSLKFVHGSSVIIGECSVCIDDRLIYVEGRR